MKAAAGALITAVCAIVLAKQNKDISLLLILAVCAMVGATALSFLEKILRFLHRLESLSGLDQQVLTILYKSIGIALIGEITAMVCADSGNAALGRVLQLLATVVILWLALPLFSALLDLAEKMLRAV